MERFFTIFWLLLIPTQLGKHFWLKESGIMGARIDYLSIILYLTDIVWFLWVWMHLRNEKRETRNEIKKLFSFQGLLMLLLVVVNIIFASARLVALYRWLRIGQWWLTWQLVAKRKNEIKTYLKWIVPLWIILEAFLGLAQVVSGGSLNGIWWWLGERRFSFGGIGIAQMRLFDEGWIRAYGSFSHPNSLAGFLLLGWWWWRKETRNLILDSRNTLLKIFYWVVNWSAIMGIIITGSRVVWALTIGLLITEQILNFKIQNIKIILGKTLLFLGTICLVLGVISVNYRLSDFVGGWDVNSWNKREMLGLSATRMIEKYPLFGVGAGNFIVNLPKFRVGNFYWMQPVHNIFLLIWSEIGVLGIIMFLVVVSERYKNFRWKKQWWFLVIVGVTGMLDHYWLTLPQNTWLLAIIMGLI